MKKFIKYCLLFNLPIIVLGVSAELLLRKIPNDYHYKKEFLDRHSDSIKVLFLGSSHAYYGINPQYFNATSFNASHVSQTLGYDYKILMKYKDHWNNLQCIALPISYFSLFERLMSGIEYWRIKNYIIYYEISAPAKFTYHSEVLSNKFMHNIRRLHSYYYDGKSEITCSSLGWGQTYNSKHKLNLTTSGLRAAQLHSMHGNQNFIYNYKMLKSIIEFAKARNIRVFLYTPPAYYTYRCNLDSLQLAQTVLTVNNIVAQYPNVTYRNFLSDSTFSARDFYDADHLDEIGARKLTRKIEVALRAQHSILSAGRERISKP